MDVTQLLYTINQEILNPLILLLFVLAFILFLYGIIRFLSKMDSDEERSIGRQAMVWGLIGMFVMVSAFAIIRLILTIIGADPSWLPF